MTSKGKLLSSRLAVKEFNKTYKHLDWSTYNINQVIYRIEFFKYCIQQLNNGQNRNMEVNELDSLIKEHRGEQCVICEENKLKGIHLYTSFICTDCEKDMIVTDTHDPKYKYYLQKLKKITTPEIFS